MRYDAFYFRHCVHRKKVFIHKLRNKLNKVDKQLVLKTFMNMKAMSTITKTHLQYSDIKLGGVIPFVYREVHSATNKMLTTKG